MSDAEGKFAFQGLDPELCFQLLAVASGRTPTFTEDYVDPRLGAVELALVPNDLDRRPPERVLRGRVVDARGDPIPRAALYSVGSREKDGSHLGGSPSEPLTVSDERGEFALGVAEPGLAVLLQVSARSYAALRTSYLEAGKPGHVITLARGATVTGRVEREGKPVAGLLMGLVQTQCEDERFLGERTIGTDAQGRFTFVNVPASDTFAVYGKAASCAALGAVAVRALATGAEESTLDAGVLVMDAGCRVKGRIVSSDGRAPLENVPLTLVREDAHDAYITQAGLSGEFVFEHAPRELCTLSLKVPGYRLAAANASLDFLNPTGLLGRVEGDALQLVLALEPGDPRKLPELDPQLGERWMALRKSPLRGAPAGEAPAAQPR